MKEIINSAIILQLQIKDNYTEEEIIRAHTELSENEYSDDKIEELNKAKMILLHYIWGLKGAKLYNKYRDDLVTIKNIDISIEKICIPRIIFGIAGTILSIFMVSLLLGIICFLVCLILFIVEQCKTLKKKDIEKQILIDLILNEKEYNIIGVIAQIVNISSVYSILDKLLKKDIRFSYLKYNASKTLLIEVLNNE